jgi:sugar phosphate permease
VGYAKIPPLIAGTAIGVISFIGFLPDLFIYNLAGSFLDKDPIGGYKTIFYMIAGCLILAIVLTLALMRYLKGRKAEEMYADIHDYAREAAKATGEA